MTGKTGTSGFVVRSDNNETIAIADTARRSGIDHAECLHDDNYSPIASLRPNRYLVVV